MKARLKKFLLNLYFWPLFSIVTLASVILIYLVRGFTLITNYCPKPRTFRTAIRLYGWVIARVIPFTAPVHLEDRSGGMPKPAILVANHLSAADPYCFGILPGEYAFMTSWPFNLPAYKWIMKKSQYLDSSDGWLNILEHSKRLLSRGCSLIIWPEGHRSVDGRLGEFQNGAFRIACETGRPVVPVCITGTHELLPPGRRLLSPARITLTLLPPRYPERAEKSRQAVQTLKNRIFQDIAEQLEANRL